MKNEILKYINKSPVAAKYVHVRVLNKVKRKEKKEEERFLDLNHNYHHMQPGQGCVVNFGNLCFHTSAHMWHRWNFFLITFP